MVNRQLYTLKFDSAKLKAFGYNIETTFDESFALGEVVALADSQMLRSIRDIRKRTLDRVHLERMIRERELLRKRRRQDAERMQTLKARINRTLYMPDYVTVTIVHKSHYEHLYRHGLVINNRRYERFSCSAGQARLSTVVFVCSDIIPELERRLNNGRDGTKMLSASKFNAYFGLASSGTRVVSEPRFIVVKDYQNDCAFEANKVLERDWNEDDDVERTRVTLQMNRMDGMGLITKRQADKWARELALDYTPCQWCVRQNFIKGMLCVFPIEEFCEEHGTYWVDTIYTNESGEPVKADLREVDVILSESQFKLWDSFPSLQAYIANCRQNRLYWGVSQFSPRQAKDILTLNYQFIQTLRLSQHDVETLCEPFVNWMEGVTLRDRGYMLLYLLGVNHPQAFYERFFSSSDSYWVKALMVNPDCVNDRYIRTKIRELTQTRIRNACMGEIFVDGNFQVAVSDPYAYMQHVCGLQPAGLLGAHEYYSRYWNERNINIVDSMRSPLTYRSEHVVARLVQNDETERWYRYCNLGFILNWHDESTVRYAGSDFD